MKITSFHLNRTDLPDIHMVLGWHLSRAVGLLVGFAYPSYASFKALESEQKDDDTQWLTYWTVFSFFNIFEYFADEIIAWFPFYYEAKLGFVAWLMLPQTLGAKYVYESILLPFLRKHEGKIDEELSHLGDRATHIVGEGKRFVKEKVGEEISRRVGDAISGGSEKEKKDE